MKKPPTTRPRVPGDPPYPEGVHKRCEADAPDTHKHCETQCGGIHEECEATAKDPNKCCDVGFYTPWVEHVSPRPWRVHPMSPVMAADIEAAGGVEHLLTCVTVEMLDEIHGEMDYHAVQMKAIARDLAGGQEAP